MPQQRSSWATAAPLAARRTHIYNDDTQCTNIIHLTRRSAKGRYYKQPAYNKSLGRYDGRGLTPDGRFSAPCCLPAVAAAALPAAEPSEEAAAAVLPTARRPSLAAVIDAAAGRRLACPAAAAMAAFAWLAAAP